MVKRIFDFFSSLIGIILLFPLFIIIFIWVKYDSIGDVFYKQTRVGINNQDFLLYKFRTMAVGSDKKGLITVGNDDVRITNSGKFLRKYKLDELPQLINVLKGDMSLVGPRPEVRKYVDLYTEEQMKVFRVKPGITDVASIKYSNENEVLKNQTNPNQYYIEQLMPEKLNLNLDYISNRSFFSDLQVIINTFTKILK
ncbi:lipopolysaccharide/colanic/teichoic acid biosynthesis glycosyltransferase [Maribacter vaceletii]|uniref:Lipopolysaccharide/colanic/teichoic acid biosynthesis glycosyltransferase n=1 Tax=Maribacter vaceletii TaxID=1206816 RepID=A0A495DT42_9FLAO|nr:sugar transferase [Maribacter vaceletii]RKR07167.1 lipopolysaccharide/colanic/teichoic acid biosynthesis glycosyltransferase [Maribacter vaceletii]